MPERIKLPTIPDATPPVKDNRKPTSIGLRQASIDTLDWLVKFKGYSSRSTLLEDVIHQLYEQEAERLRNPTKD